MHHFNYLIGFFFFAVLSTFVCLFEAATFPFCAIHECCASSGGWLSLVYGVSVLLNTMLILGTGYHGLYVSYYYISWKMKCREEDDGDKEK